MPALRRRWTPADVRAPTSEEHARPRYELIDRELLALFIRIDNKLRMFARAGRPTAT